MIKIANHSAYKTAFTNLFKENNHPLHVSQLSGHIKYSKSKVVSYCLDIAKKHMSEVLSKADDYLLPLRNLLLTIIMWQNQARSQ